MSDNSTKDDGLTADEKRFEAIEILMRGADASDRLRERTDEELAALLMIHVWAKIPLGDLHAEIVSEAIDRLKSRAGNPGSTPDALSETVTVGSGEQAYTIKPLEWIQCNNPHWQKAFTIDGGWYMVSDLGDAHAPGGQRLSEINEGTFETGKAAAERHYRERLSPALSPSPSPPAAAGEGDVRFTPEEVFEAAKAICAWTPADFEKNRGKTAKTLTTLAYLAARVVSQEAEREADTKRMAWMANYVLGIDASICGVEMLDQYDVDNNPDGRDWTAEEDAAALRKTLDLAMAKEAAALSDNTTRKDG